jgi:hypothetical protein
MCKCDCDCGWGFTRLVFFVSLLTIPFAMAYCYFFEGRPMHPDSPEAAAMQRYEAEYGNPGWLKRYREDYERKYGRR